MLFLPIYHIMSNGLYGSHVGSALIFFGSLVTPTFAFITGYFMANKEKSRFIKFGCVFIGYGIITTILCSPWICLIDGNAGGMAYGFARWYVITLLIVYLFAPFINLGIKNFNKYITLAIILSLYFVLIYAPPSLMSSWDTTLVSLPKIIYMIVLYSFGAWFLFYGQAIIKDKYFIICSYIYIVAFVVANICVGWANANQSRWNIMLAEQTNPQSFFGALCIFTIFNSWNVKGWIPKYLGYLSFGIFMFNWFPIDLINHFMMQKLPHNDLYWLLETIIILVFDVALSVIGTPPARWIAQKTEWTLNFFWTKITNRHTLST